ncbi:hypothetical protein LTR66_009898 [Elasticomyces elasticus]|nr:hypothetical protein LTR66_009898 [Elasticomyces elasticus]
MLGGKHTFSRWSFLFISVAALLALLTLWSVSTDSRKQPLPPLLSHGAAEWTYEYPRHSLNYGLTNDQCDAAFPGLFKEIERSVAYWRKSGGIRPSNIELSWRESGVVRMMIYNGQLYVLESKLADVPGAFHERTSGVLNTLNRAILSSPAPLPNVELSFVIDDIARLPEHTSHTILAFSRHASDPVGDRVWVMPDFSFWSWPGISGSWPSTQQEVIEREATYADKIAQIVWRGALDMNYPVRGSLIKESQGKPWSAIMTFNWSDPIDKREKKISMADHCKYKFTAHTEGISYSGRMKYLLNCHSLTFIHELEWVQHYHHLLVPNGSDQNYVPMSRDWKELPQRVEYYMANTHEAEKVADNAVKHFRERYLSPAAEACYWRKLVMGWANVSWVPELFDANGKTRGSSWEEYSVNMGEYPKEERKD